MHVNIFTPVNLRIKRPGMIASAIYPAFLAWLMFYIGYLIVFATIDSYDSFDRILDTVFY